MNILITGAKGFVGKNLIPTLNNIKEGKDKSFGITSDLNIFEYDLDTDPALLDDYCRQADFVLHLAGVNRTANPDDFMSGNFGFTSTLLDTLKKHKNTCPVMISSSKQAADDNPYGKSKKAGEDLIFDYSKETGADVLVYRFVNIFGKWCRPNYNSAVATFCHNIARDLPITINGRDTLLTLVYIDDVVAELIRALNGQATKTASGYCDVPVFHTATLGEIVDLLNYFKDSRKTLSVPDMSDSFTKKLYATYLSYLQPNEFAYPLTMNIDNRGSFTEILRTADRGQFSVNITKPGITKG
ncbi:MAG: NAD-dependent epimerase/dehydratase family protein, partial [Bacillota bacterium]|nr:NAD-dependent epimerase/dehydratase family protein [Bacillota bacterium]